MARSFIDRLCDIRQAILDIDAFTDGFDQPRFLASPRDDRMVFRAVSSSFAVISEAVKDLPDEIKDKHPHIPWRSIAGMRDWLVHEYFRVEPEILWQTVEDRYLQELLDAIESELEEE